MVEMKWKKVLKLFIGVLITVISTTLFVRYNELVYIFVGAPEYRTNHFNIFSVAAILVGFMFTALGMLISISDKKLIEKLAQTKIIDKKNGRIISGMKCDVICILLSIIYISGLDSLLPEWLRIYIVVCELMSIGIGIMYLIWAMNDMMKLLNLIRPAKDMSNERIEELKNIINNKE